MHACIRIFLSLIDENVPIRIQKLARPANMISPTRRRQREHPPTGSQNPLLWGSTLVPTLLQEFSPLSVQVHSSIDGIFPTHKQPRTNSAVWLFALGDLMFVSAADGISPTRKQQHKLIKPLHSLPTILEIKISTLKRNGHINSKKPTV